MNTPYRVAYSEAVRAELRELLESAFRRSEAFGEEAVAAVKALEERLRTDPRTFGERRYSLSHLRLEVRIAVVPPLAVSFSVHEPEPLVFVTAHRLLGGPS